MNEDLDRFADGILDKDLAAPIRAVKLFEFQCFMYGFEISYAARAYAFLAMLAHLKNSPTQKLPKLSPTQTRSGMMKELLEYYLPPETGLLRRAQFPYQIAVTDLKQELTKRRQRSAAAIQIMSFSYRYAKNELVTTTRKGGATMAISVIEDHRREFGIKKSTRTIEKLWSEFKDTAPLLYLLDEAPELDVPDHLLLRPNELSQTLIQLVTRNNKIIRQFFGRYNEVVTTLRQNGYDYSDVGNFDLVAPATPLTSFSAPIEKAIGAYQTKRGR